MQETIDKKSKLDEINKDNWKQILYDTSYDEEKNIQYLQTHEEEILSKIFEDRDDLKSLEDKRKAFIRSLLDQNLYSVNMKETIYYKIYDEIERIRKNQDASILQMRIINGGASHKVFEFGNRIIKFGKTFPIINDPNILQPETELLLEDGYENRMTVFEKLQTYESKDYKITQIMYNRLRDRGILWLDAHGDNIGRTSNLRDENDDGLRIIDAECMKNAYEVQQSLKPIQNQYGVLDRGLAFKHYMQENGYWKYEEEYRKMCDERRIAQYTGIKKVASESSFARMKKAINFFVKKIFSLEER